MESNKSKLFIISGSTASSKDTTLKELSNRGIVRTLLSTTTRPIRATEKQGREYNFITKEEFNEKEFVEKRMYTVANGDIWYYGLSYEEIYKCYNNFGNYAVILDVQGMRTLKEFISKEKEFINKEFKNDIEVITIMLQASYYTRLVRYLNRDKLTNDTVKEAIRRINADMNEIEPFINEYDIVLKTEDDDLERNIKIIKSLCD